MTVEFFCPSGHRLSAPDDWAGRQFRCPVCKQYSVVPEACSEEPPTSGAASPASQSPVEPQLPADEELRPSASDLAPGESRDDVSGGRESQQEPKPVGNSPAVGPPPLPSADSGGAAGQTVLPHTRKDPLPAVAEIPAEKTGFHGSVAERLGGRSSRRGRASGRLPADVYQADRGKLQTTRWLAFVLALVVLFSVAPVVVLGKLDLQTAPGWARLVVLLAALEAVYVVWMAAAPDWSSVWVVMLVFALAASGYGMATAVAAVTPSDRPMPLGMDEVRQTAFTWCLAVLLVNSLATYLCGRTSTRWRRAFELEMAARRRAAANTRTA